MELELALWLIPAVLAGAWLDAALGQGGALAYVAVMALAGLAPAKMRPIALVPNVAVASIGTWKSLRVGFFDARLLAGFAVFSLPLAYWASRRVSSGIAAAWMRRRPALVPATAGSKLASV
jgi:uncharacterized membrane protein YfcA